MPKSRMARNFKARKGISRNYTLLARQKEFPKLTCKKNLPTPDTKDNDNPNNIKYILKEMIPSVLSSLQSLNLRIIIKTLFI